jgi:hypothetical protein
MLLKGSLKSGTLSPQWNSGVSFVKHETSWQATFEFDLMRPLDQMMMMMMMMMMMKKGYIFHGQLQFFPLLLRDQFIVTVSDD